MRWLSIALAAVLLLSPTRVLAAEPANHGLYISPVRQFVTIAPGDSKLRSLVVGNYSSTPLTVTLSVRQFSLGQFGNDFKFLNDTTGWLKLDEPSATLQPKQTRSLRYHLQIPADATVGGHYFALVATANGQPANNQQLVQAASLLYITVQGPLDYGSGLPASSIRHINLRDDIPYSLDITNTGNVHYYIYLSASVKGLFGSRQSSETHLLLPQTRQHFPSTVSAPRLPGIYTVTYGYSSERQPMVSRVSRVVYVPLWSVAAAVVAAWAVLRIIRRRLRVRRHRSVDD